MEKKNYLEVVKDATTLATGFGVTSIMLDAVKFVAPGKIGLLAKVTRFLGAAAISGLVSDKCSKYMGEQLDKITTEIEDSKEEETPEEPVET